jgi:hypothetical protein
MELYLAKARNRIGAVEIVESQKQLKGLLPDND